MKSNRFLYLICIQTKVCFDTCAYFYYKNNLLGQKEPNLPWELKMIEEIRGTIYTLPFFLGIHTKKRQRQYWDALVRNKKIDIAETKVIINIQHKRTTKETNILFFITRSSGWQIRQVKNKLNIIVWSKFNIYAKNIWRDMVKNNSIHKPSFSNWFLMYTW